MIGLYYMHPAFSRPERSGAKVVYIQHFQLVFMLSGCLNVAAFHDYFGGFFTKSHQCFLKVQDCEYRSSQLMGSIGATNIGQKFQKISNQVLVCFSSHQKSGYDTVSSGFQRKHFCSRVFSRYLTNVRIRRWLAVTERCSCIYQHEVFRMRQDKWTKFVPLCCVTCV